jgi:hypothetical protein
MKKTVLTLLLVGLLAAAAAAQTPVYIGLFADSSGNDCNLVANIGTTLSVNVVCVGAPSRGVEFAADPPAGLVWLAFSPAPNVLYIDSADPPGFGGGFSLADNTCIDSPHWYGFGLYLVSGVVPTCTTWVVTEHSISMGPWYVDCQNVQHQAATFTATVNGDATCSCGVPSYESSWGKIKALYE